MFPGGLNDLCKVKVVACSYKPAENSSNDFCGSSHLCTEQQVFSAHSFGLKAHNCTDSRKKVLKPPQTSKTGKVSNYILKNPLMKELVETKTELKGK